MSLRDNVKKAHIEKVIKLIEYFSKEGLTGLNLGEFEDIKLDLNDEDICNKIKSAFPDDDISITPHTNYISW